MLRPTLISAAAAAAIAIGSASSAHVSHVERFHAQLVGFNEVPTLISDGHGTLDLALDRDAKTVTYRLTFSAFPTAVTQSHIHLGKVHTSGGVMVFFCTNLGNGPAGTPACPSGGGTVTGTINGGDVVAVPAQNVTAGDFDDLVDALESHSTYANVHTTAFPAGEIRGEIIRVDRF
jgi:hypothetical protein